MVCIDIQKYIVIQDISLLLQEAFMSVLQLSED